MTTLPKAPTFSPLKMDGRNTIVSFLGWPLPQGGYLALLTSRQGATVPELHLGDSGKWRR